MGCCPINGAYEHVEVIKEAEHGALKVVPGGNNIGEFSGAAICSIVQMSLNLR